MRQVRHFPSKLGLLKTKTHQLRSAPGMKQQMTLKKATIYKILDTSYTPSKYRHNQWSRDMPPYHDDISYGKAAYYKQMQMGNEVFFWRITVFKKKTMAALNESKRYTREEYYKHPNINHAQKCTKVFENVTNIMSSHWKWLLPINREKKRRKIWYNLRAEEAEDR